MKVALGTVNVSRLTRRAIADFYGQEGLADRETVRNFYLSHALADVTAVVADFEENYPVEASELRAED